MRGWSISTRSALRALLVIGGLTVGMIAAASVPTASAAIASVKKPGAPKEVTATPGNKMAVVSWNAPANDGGSTITGYTVTSTPASKTCTTTGLTTCTVKKLTNGTAYSFKVTATNTKGTGKPSAASAPVTPEPPGPLTGAVSVASGSSGSCALSGLGAVDCWGYGADGELGNGVFYTTGPVFGSKTPVQVEGLGGVGTLTGVQAVTSGYQGLSFCALLVSSAVDCWGYGPSGELGNGVFYTGANDGSATPVAVEGVGGVGTLTGVQSVVGDGSGFCAVLESGGVDCWGYGSDAGELGNGSFTNSATPVEVEAVGGVGALSGVKSMVADSYDSYDEVEGGYCALLGSGGVDCWGDGGRGQLGNGVFLNTGDVYGSATPVTVESVGGSGTLSGVQSLVGETGWNGGGYCALLQSSGVDCWGFGDDGELGNGNDSNSATPVEVEGIGGVGTLSEVQSVLANAASYCALLNSGAVDCWGDGQGGQLGSGSGYSSSATPVEVEGIGGVGTLSGVQSVVASETSFEFQYDSYCAVLDSGAVDCWGDSEDGELGDGDIDGSSGTPVAVEGVGGVGTLADAQNVVAGSSGENYCAVLGSGDVDCWGGGGYGALGDGKASDSGTPVAVEAP